jgi:cytochrome c5
MKVRTTAPIVGMLAVASPACSGPKTADAPPPLTPNEIELASHAGTGMTRESVERGRQTFLAECNRCHGYPDIGEIRADRWPEIVKRMGKNARLTTEQEDEVLVFVKMVAARR